MKDGSLRLGETRNISIICIRKKRIPACLKTVLTNGSTFKNAAVETFVGGKTERPLDGATPTGYYLKKYVVRNDQSESEQYDYRSSCLDTFQGTQRYC